MRFYCSEQEVSMAMKFGSRRGKYIDISKELTGKPKPLSPGELRQFEAFDLMYRSLCTLLFNYVPLSGHPGGSISSGRFVMGMLFDSMDYDFTDPDRQDADIISFGAGHKALGIYALWALRNEIIRLGAPHLLPGDETLQLRLEDLLGFRRNPVTKTPLFLQYHAKPLDGHPTPATPFVRLSTGASGVGTASSLGLAYGALDFFGASAPTVHIVEGEGGLTPGRVSEALAAAGTSSLKNAVLHIDWNQASIDSNHVCRDKKGPGDYVQWTPMELAYLHDWNVIYVPQGSNFQQIFAAQRRCARIKNSQPTAMVYRTIKGWQYGIEGRGSHGAGHALCSDGFFKALEPFTHSLKGTVPNCGITQLCKSGKDSDAVESCFWNALLVVRSALEDNPAMIKMLTGRVVQARERLIAKKRQPRNNGPQVQEVYRIAEKEGTTIPETLTLAPNTVTTLRSELGRVLRYYNKISSGALLVASADLLGSTSVNTAAKDFPDGFYNSVTNPKSRTLSVGGICEDAMSGILSGLSTYGCHIGVGSSYAAFMAPLGHIASRLHAIGNQARQALAKGPYRPMILVCAHAGVKTGEDGPTHAEPQSLQLLQENFPQGTMITLTPWDPQEIWTLITAAFMRRPAVIAPFVTRPNEKIVDRTALGLAPVSSAATGVYLLKPAVGKRDGALVLQGSEVANAFLEEALPLLKQKGIDLDVYYVASAELFDLLSDEEKEKIFPATASGEAMGITGFTLPTMYRWIRSERGRAMTIYPYKNGHFLGSGPAHMVLAEAELDGKHQYEAVMKYLERKG
jgi:transketolase